MGNLSSLTAGLGRDAVVLTAGHAVLTGGQWATVVTVGRLLGSSELGRYALALGIAAPVFLLTNLNLRTVQATDVGTQRIASLTYASLRIRTSLAATSFILLVGVVFWSLHDIRLLLSVAVLKFADSLSDVYYGDRQRRGEMVNIGISSAVRGVTLASVVLVSLVAGLTLTVAITCASVVWLIIALTWDRRASRGEEPLALTDSPMTGRLRQLLVMALPLGMVAALDSLNANVPKYLLDIFRDKAAVGSFSAALSLVFVGGVVLSGFGNALLPRISRYWHLGDVRSIERLALRSSGVVTLLGILVTPSMFLWGDHLMMNVFGSDFADTRVLVGSLFMAGTVWYAVTIWGFALNGIRAFRPQVPLFLVVAGSALGLGFWLIPTYGMTGAALTFGGTQLVRAIGTGLIWLRMRTEVDVLA